MGRLIFLLEEPSMEALLQGLLPRLFPELRFLCIPHEGKDDLDNSIRRTLRDWRTPGDRFVVVRDNDGADCITLKGTLQQLCRAGRREDTLIRIVCQELEAWYLGDPDAMAEAFGDRNLANIRNRPKYRNPDSLHKPSDDVERLVSGYRKIAGAGRMANYMSRDDNRSHSFSIFINGIEKLMSS